MDAERRAYIRSLYQTALRLDAPGRESFLRALCAGDADLRAEVDRLLAQDPPAEIERSTLAIDASTVHETIDRPTEGSRVDCPYCRTLVLVPDSTQLTEWLCPSCGHRTEWVGGSSKPPTLGPKERSFGRFELLSILGVGSFGRVYRARDTKLDRVVALKVLRSGDLASRIEIDRFLREARSMAQLRHRAIVPVHDADEYDGMPFIVSELIDGVDLAKRIKGGRLSFTEAAAIVAEVADALDYAHGCGVIHRDVKPSNIMYGANGRPYVMDFGLAKRSAGEVTMTMAGELLGTPAYMSPEQARGEAHRVDGRSDVYSLGVVLYELLTGELPFRGHTPMLVHQVLNQEPRPPRALDEAIPRDLETVCLKAMDKEKSRRYASAGELAADLRRFLAHEPVLARPIGAPTKLVLWARRNPWVAALSTAVGVLALGAVAAAAIAVMVQLSASANLKANTLRLIVQNAKQLVQAGAMGHALPWYVEALKLESGDPSREAVHRIRIASVIRGSLRPWRVWSQPGGVEAVCFGADGRLLTCGAIGRVHDLRNPELESGSSRPVADDPSPVTCRSAAFGPDGPIAVMTSDDGRIWVENPVNGRAAFSPIGEPAVDPKEAREARSPLKLAVLGPGGRCFAVARGRLVEIRESSTGQLIGAPMKHPDPVNDVAFSPDGRQLLVGYGGYEETVGEAWLWQVGANEALPSKRFPHQDDVYSVAFSDDGRFALTSSFDRTARVWDVKTGSPGATIHLSERINIARFNSDGSRIATASISEARLWDAATGKPIGAPMRHPGEIQLLRFNPEGSRLLTLASDRTVRLWDTRDGQPAWEPLTHDDPVTVATFTPDGEKVVTACRNGITRCWDLVKNLPGHTPFRHSEYVRHAELGAGGSRVVTTSIDGTARAWDVATGKAAGPALLHPAEVTSASMSRDGQRIVTACAQGPARLWNSNGQGIAELGPESPARFAGFVAGGARILVSGDGWGVLWDGSPRRLATLEAPGPIESPEFSPDGRLASAVCERDVVRVWSLDDGKAVGKALWHDRVRSVAFGPDGNRLVTAGDDGMACVWDFRTGRLITRIGHNAPILHAAFSPDGTRLVTAGADHDAALWDVETGHPLTARLPHDAPVLRAAFSPDGRLLATGSGYDIYRASGSVRLWDATTGDFVSLPIRHGAGVHRLEFSSNGRSLLTASRRDRAARLWAIERSDVPLADLESLAQVFAGARVDDRGGQTPIAPGDYERAHRGLAIRYPDLFAADRRDRAAQLDEEARSFAESGHWDWALKRLDRLVDDEPGDPDILRRRGEAHAKLRHWDQAAYDYLRAIEAGSDDDEFVWLPAAALFVRMGDWDRVNELSARLLEDQGDLLEPVACEILVTIASLASNARPDPRVVKLALRAQEARPRNHEPLTALGAALLRANRLEEAARWLREALAAHPGGGTIDARSLLSIVERRRGHAADADRLLLEAEEALRDLDARAPEGLALSCDLRQITLARLHEAEQAR